jgi:hypothetical protein
MSFVDPASLAPQGDSLSDSAERREVKLTLVIEGERGRREYETDADAAWTFFNDAYDHAAGTFEDTDASDGAYYQTR